jgi:ubiquinol-cytochrome c reductase cytochrome c subunit
VWTFALLTAGVLFIWSLVWLPFGLGSPVLNQASQGGQNLVEEGQKIFQSQPCLGCHTVDGRGGAVGPNLSDEGAKGRTLDWLKTQILDPKSHDPSTVMPSFKNLSPHQVDALAAYLQSLRGKPSAAVQPEAPASKPGAGGDLPLGGELFRLNCAPCHEATGRGGGLVGTNINAPSLAKVAPAAIPAFIRSGPGPMPAFNEYIFSEKQIASIVLYVEELQNAAHPGGFGLAYLGTLPEGFVAIVFGLGLAVLAAILIEWKGRG